MLIWRKLQNIKKEQCSRSACLLGNVLQELFFQIVWETSAFAMKDLWRQIIELDFAHLQ